MLFRLPAENEGWTLEQYEKQMIGIVTNLQNNILIKVSLVHICNISFPYSLIKKYDLISLVSSFTHHSDFKFLVESCKVKLRRIRDKEKQRKKDKRAAKRSKDLGLDLSSDESDATENTDDEGKQPTSSNHGGERSSSRSDSKSKKDKKDKKKDRKRHHEGSGDEANEPPGKQSKELVLKIVDILGKDETSQLKASRKKARAREQRKREKEEAAAKAALEQADDIDTEPETEETPTISRPAGSSRAVDLRLNSTKKPTPVVPVKAKEPAAPKFNDEDMFRPRKDVRKVFAGRRKTKITEIFPLLELCQTTLMQNPTQLMKCVGWTPFELIEPSLKLCSTDQLLHFATLNPNLHHDLDPMFEKLVRREFPLEKRLPSKYDHWHKFYVKLSEKKNMVERIKMEKLTAKIVDRQKSTDTGRRTQLINEAHAPKNVRARQANNGLAHTMKPTPSAKELSQARKAVGEGDRSQLAAMPSAVVNRPSRPSGPSGSSRPSTSSAGSSRPSTSAARPSTSSRTGTSAPRNGAAPTGFLMRKTLKMLGIKSSKK